MARILNEQNEYIEDILNVTVQIDFQNSIIKGKGMPPEIAQLGIIPNLAGGWVRTWNDPIFVAPSVAKVLINILKAEVNQFIFMDVGLWAHNQRNFGIIYGGVALLCNYKSDKSGNKNYTIPAHLVKDYKTNLTIDYTILKNLVNNLDTINIIKAEFCPESHELLDLINYDSIYVFIPDCHIPVVSKARPETIQIGFNNNRIDIDDYKFGDNISSYAYQLAGWHKRYKIALIDWYNGTMNTTPDIDLINFSGQLSSINEKFLSGKLNLIQIGDFIDFWVGFDQLFITDNTNDIVRAGVDLSQVSILKVNNLDVAKNFVNHWMDIATKDENYHDLIEAFDKVVSHYIWGNHDNYLGIMDLTNASSNKYLHPRSKFYRENGLFVEHGHRVDIKNRDGADGGHFITRKLFQQVPGFSRDSEPFLREYQTTPIGLSYLWSKYFSQPSIDIFDNNRFWIYVMGHTHSPILSKINITIEDVTPPPAPLPGGYEYSSGFD